MKEILKVKKLDNGEYQVIKIFKNHKFPVATFHNYLGTSKMANDIGGSGKNIAQLHAEEYVKIIEKAIEIINNNKTKKK